MTWETSGLWGDGRAGVSLSWEKSSLKVVRSSWVLADGVLGTVAFGWAPLCPLWLKAHTDSGNGAFGLVTHLLVFSARDLERMTTGSEGVPVVMIRRSDGPSSPAKQRVSRTWVPVWVVAPSPWT